MEAAPKTPSQLYSVQCTKCFKWRLIPTVEKYEEVREAMNEQPFSCENAREWQAGISYDNVADITLDSGNVWGFDMPCTAKTPPGWKRIVKIRHNRNSRFADVYYVSPTNRRLRSLVETQRYLDEHPEEGPSISQFCFQTPEPWDGSHVDEN